MTSALQVIELFAGNDPQGHPVVERLSVRQNGDESFQLIKSPAFIKGLAGGDEVTLLEDSKEFEIKQRSGNLCIRVYAKSHLAEISEQLTPELEKLGGDLDTETARFLIYSIHVSCGFTAIESLLNQYVTSAGGLWIYGNVYDPEDGVTPLNWWLDILQPE